MNLLINAGGHSGEAIPVPIPNTEVKLSYVDDTALQRESRKLLAFFYLTECIVLIVGIFPAKGQHMKRRSLIKQALQVLLRKTW